ncbi:MAG: hypothetical protein R3C16_04240 [Hyphomonadaceae bacterium]
MREIVLLDWRGALGTEGLSSSLAAPTRTPTPRWPRWAAEERAILREVGARRAAWTEQAASAMLRVARDWVKIPRSRSCAFATVLAG